MTGKLFNCWRRIGAGLVLGSLTGISTASLGAAPAPYQIMVQDGEGQEIFPLPLPGDWLVLLGTDADRVVVLGVQSTGGAGESEVDLQSGDRVASLEGVADPTMGRLRQLLSDVEPGDTISLDVMRGDQRVSYVFRHQGLPLGFGGGGSWSSEGDGRGETAGTLGGPDPMVEALLGEFRAGAPGVSVAVSTGGAVVYTATRGLASMEPATPMTPETMLPAASVTKMVTGFLIASLAAEGRLALDAELRTLLPELAALDGRLRVHHLLYHTSGLKDYTGLLSLTGWEYGEAIAAEDLLALLSRQTELHFAPGERHQYSNTNYFLLAQIVERVTGESFAAFADQHAFQPARLNNTSLGTGAGGSTADRYREGPRGLERVESTAAVLGPSGMLTTASDLTTWAGALMSGELGGPTILETMALSGRLTDGTEAGYGMGVGTSDFRGVQRLQHSGSAPGVQATLHMYPAHEIAVAVMANRSDIDIAELADALAAAHLPGAAAQAATTSSTSTLPRGAMMLTDEDIAGAGIEGVLDPDAARLAGRYRLDDGGEWVIGFREGRLELVLAAGAPGVPLAPLPDGTFYFGPGRWTIEFTEGPDGAGGIIAHIGEESVRRGEPRDIVGSRIVVAPLSPADRRAMAGAYFSPELGVSYTVTADGDELFLETPRNGRRRMIHEAGDVFVFEDGPISHIEVTRAENGAVTGILVHAFAWGATAHFTRN